MRRDNRQFIHGIQESKTDIKHVRATACRGRAIAIPYMECSEFDESDDTASSAPLFVPQHQPARARMTDIGV